jgi:hypothetical protein
MEIEMTIKGLMIDPITNMPIVILKDKAGDRVLPIWVGVFEANAIALQIENISTPRPMTHDLIKNILSEIEADVQRIVVSDLRDNTFGMARRSPSTLARAMRSRSPSERARRSSSRTRWSTAPRASTSRKNPRTPKDSKSGWKG